MNPDAARNPVDGLWKLLKMAIAGHPMFLQVAEDVAGTTAIDNFREDLDLIREAIVLVSTPSGFGAGFVVDPSGLVLTNHHVVREEKFVRVTLYDANGEGTTPIDDVELLAFSRLHDIALLQIPEEGMPEEPLVALNLAGDDATHVGDLCFAIGNPGMGRQILSQSVGEGIVSSLQRNFYGILYMQTTAPVNPGNSGGPLLDASGNVIGLITYKAWLENVGFALPVHEIRRFLNNRAAFLADDLNPNAGHRYLVPGAATD